MAITLPEFGERIMALPGGGFSSDEGRFDRKFIYNLIHTATAQAKRIEFTRNHKIHQAWYFPYFPEFVKDAQIDNCFYRFKIPQQISLDARQTGLGYLGTLQFNQQYRVTIGRSKFAAQQHDRVMKVRDDRTDVLIENGYMEVYGGKPQKFRVEGIWADPTECDNYNIERDSYPISADLIPEVEKIILQTDMVIITRSAIDAIQDKKDSSAIARQ